MTLTETNPIGTMERLRRCEEALRSALNTLGEQKRRCERWSKTTNEISGAMKQIEAVLFPVALTPMTKPEQEGV